MVEQILDPYQRKGPSEVRRCHRILILTAVVLGRHLKELHSLSQAPFPIIKRFLVRFFYAVAAIVVGIVPATSMRERGSKTG